MTKKNLRIINKNFITFLEKPNLKNRLKIMNIKTKLKLIQSINIIIINNFR